MIFAFIEAAPLDPSTSSVLQMIGSLGQAGGIMLAVWMFLGYLKSSNANKAAEDAARDKRWEELADRIGSQYSNVVKDNSDAWRELSRSLGTICKAGSNSRP